ncbi:LIM domain-containing protein WLIM2b-like [Mangifera indica]|uniref:LIM domain-containing protein WLIM2b-like n=1 Tax=Mangifera indica TaxID=29780 RepID=UPI001CF9FD82|nr:LIM domain-containing protein WLIM2b-like [Mangifera indica]
MSFNGTHPKCKACDKTVYFAEMITADGVPYHKTCFKCSHCNGVLQMGRYSTIEGILYCKPHFEQLFKETGSFTNKFQAAKTPTLTKSPSKLSFKFSGTQDKCALCKKTVYPLEKVTVEGEFYHKTCFRCSHGGCFLTTSNYAALDGVLYCKPHFTQLFKEKGSYTHLNKCSSTKKMDVPPIPDTAKPESEPEPEPKSTQDAEATSK